MHSDHSEYFRYTNKSRLDKAVNSLLGTMEGITIDARISPAELKFLTDWINDHQSLRDRHPFNEILPVISSVLEDGVITGDEREDIIWLCERFCSTEYYSTVTAGIQRLHAIMGAIASDRIITEEELNGLTEWLQEHEYLRRCWPYDEVETVITTVMADGKIDEKEHEYLLTFFDEFTAAGGRQTIACPPVSAGKTVNGLCTVCPTITFKDSLFCFTGASRRCSRDQFEEIVRILGGHILSSVTPYLDYLVIGSEGNPCWAYACYGRKVEKAIQLRKQGSRLLLVHENDFHDAVEEVIG